MQLIGYRKDRNGEQMLLAVHRGNYYVRYKNEDKQVNLSYEMVSEGTYKDAVRDVPYFVLEQHVYPIKSFESLSTERKKMP